MSAEGNLNAKINLRHASVLLVESNQHAVDTLAQIMTGLGVGEVHRAMSAEEADNIVRNKSVDLIIIEPSLRDSDGFAFIKELRLSRREPACSVPVIIISSLVHPTDVARARDTGANFVVAKPITPNTLLQRMLWIGRDKRPFVRCRPLCRAGPALQIRGPPPGVDGRRSTDVDSRLGDASAPNMSQNEIDGFIRPQRVSLD